MAASHHFRRVSTRFAMAACSLLALVLSTVHASFFAGPEIESLPGLRCYSATAQQCGSTVSKPGSPAGLAERDYLAYELRTTNLPSSYLPVVEAAVADWFAMFEPGANTVTVEVVGEDLVGLYAEAETVYFEMPNHLFHFPGKIIVPSALRKAVANPGLRDWHGTDPDVKIWVDTSERSWNLDPERLPTPNEVDLQSVIMHELGHGFGFGGSNTDWEYPFVLDLLNTAMVGGHLSEGLMTSSGRPGWHADVGETELRILADLGYRMRESALLVSQRRAAARSRVSGALGVAEQAYTL